MFIYQRVSLHVYHFFSEISQCRAADLEHIQGMRADCARHGTQSADGTYTRPTVCMERNQSGLPMISHGFLGIQNPSKIS